jgi:hypothetical protein
MGVGLVGLAIGLAPDGAFPLQRIPTRRPARTFLGLTEVQAVVPGRFGSGDAASRSGGRSRNT